MRIVIDAYGGDNGPRSIIEGLSLALAQWDDFDAVLTGDETELLSLLTEYSIPSGGRISVFHAPDVISCDEQPTLAVKRKKNSSLVAALNMMAEKKADCLISAGSTGALLTGATLIVRRIPGVKRPALAPIMPSGGKPFLLLDCGANADCKPEYLQQFAIMGSAYMEGVMGIASPKVALISNGTEDTKGNELTKEAHALIAKTGVNFAGNCEARDIFNGDIDVFVTDGFTGNIVLKEAEGFAIVLFKILKRELTSSFVPKLGALLAKPAFKKVKKQMDYTEYGGAPLLGINGGIIKAHGSSDANAVFSAIRQARLYVHGGVTEKIAESIARAEAEASASEAQKSND